ncbi:hypothetical protein BDV10DRAFT_159151 [Aspergillus recurvatus]
MHFDMTRPETIAGRPNPQSNWQSVTSPNHLEANYFLSELCSLSAVLLFGLLLSLLFSTSSSSRAHPFSAPAVGTLVK